MSRQAGRYPQLRKRLDAFARNAKRVYLEDSDALHDLRVASRRLREIVPVLPLTDRAARQIDRRLRNVTRRLGAVRDFDILLPLIGELGRHRRFSAAALARLRDDIEAARSTARDRLPDQLPPAKVWRLSRRLERAATRVKQDDERGGPAGGRRSRRDWKWTLAWRATNRSRGVRSAIRAAGTAYVSASLHEVRIALKKLRYTIELETAATGRPASPDVARLKAGQDLLGRLHDLETLAARARRVEAALASGEPEAARAMALLRGALESHCRTLHARYVRQRQAIAAAADRLGHASKAGGGPRSGGVTRT